MQLKDRDFILVDLETTGFNKDKHQILEVGILVIKNNKISKFKVSFIYFIPKIAQNFVLGFNF